MIQKLLSFARRFFCSSAFPAYVITLAVIYEVFLLLIWIAPEGFGFWSDFSTDFKVWCFSYDPKTGHLEWISVWIMFAEPLFITGLILLIWNSSLRQLTTLNGWRTQAGPVGGALVTLLLILGGMMLYAQMDADPKAPQPFPGERIRTRLDPPSFTLNDQRGNPCSLDDLRGKPVLITGIYALCSQSCPEILLQIRSTLDALPEAIADELQILAISLNPEYDTPQLMDSIASANNFNYPHFRYLNGEPDQVRSILSRLQFSTYLNPETGFIDHNNLFILIDPEGLIAYRFSLNPEHRSWLGDAIVSVSEAPVRQNRMQLSSR